MPDVHRPGRIGGNVFDIDRRALPHVAAAIIHPGKEHRAQCRDPGRRLERQIDEARAGHLRPSHEFIGAQLGGDRLGQFGRRLARVFRQHHGRVGGHIAVACLARRLHHDPRLIDAGRQNAVRDQRIIGGAYFVQHRREDVLIVHGQPVASERAA